MREVRIFLAPAVYDRNPQLVEGLRLNRIQVERFDVATQSHADAADQQIQVCRQPLCCACPPSCVVHVQSERLCRPELLPDSA